MNELVQDLEYAYKMISSIPVSGDAVDMMAMARAKLRKQRPSPMPRMRRALSKEL